MNSFKKILRTTGLILLIMLALMGVGIAGAPFLPKNREKYLGKETTIELVENKTEAEEKERT